MNAVVRSFCVEVEDMETIATLVYYLCLPAYIYALEQEYQCISSNYYALHSFTGAGVNGMTGEAGQPAIYPDTAVFQIIADEYAVQHRMEKLRGLYGLFLEGVTEAECELLREDLHGDDALLRKACEWVEEIEYYQQQHSDSAEGIRPSVEAVADIESLENELFEMFGV